MQTNTYTDKATPELLSALALAQGEIENASKNAANPHFKSKYADLAEILNTTRPVFAKHGLSLSQFPGYDGSLCCVTTIIGHKGGGYITGVSACVPAKADAQGIGSATTYLRRYSAAAAAGIAQEDDDGNAAAHNKPHAVITPQQAATLREYIEATGSDTAKFCAAFAVDSVDSMPVAKFDAALKALQKKSQQAA